MYMISVLLYFIQYGNYAGIQIRCTYISVDSVQSLPKTDNAPINLSTYHTMRKNFTS